MVPARPRVKSEYMKRFKEPKWESCGPCYRELLRYRLSRRLLEQAHRPWLWDGWEPDSSGSSAGSPSPPSTSPPAAQQQQEAAAPGAPGPGGSSRAGGPGAAGKASPAEPLRAAEKETEEDDQEKVAEQTLVKETDKSTSCTGQPSRSVLSSRNDRRSAKSPQRTDAAKEHKHPFALYGWGEKRTDTGSQKTHNVCASASVHEIHESALRAKNRRQVEKRKLSQKRVRSTDVDRTWRVKPSPPDNPWMTEYMRCYSARAR